MKLVVAAHKAGLGEHVTNDATPLIVEYFERRAMAKMGVTTTMGAISSIKADELIMCDLLWNTKRKAKSPIDDDEGG